MEQPGTQLHAIRDSRQGLRNPVDGLWPGPYGLCKPGKVDREESGIWLT